LFPRVSDSSQEFRGVSEFPGVSENVQEFQIVLISFRVFPGALSGVQRRYMKLTGIS
jgi:hypothetical protein